jgi:hypothetical protein
MFSHMLAQAAFIGIGGKIHHKFFTIHTPVSAGCAGIIVSSAMITDLTPYREDMAAFDMSDEQKLELVNAIWVIGKTILDRKFGLYQPDAPKERVTAVDSCP